ncbi:MAG: O-antigen ligase family protein [Lachnospiraceae bacterium]|nr:O-antigen ligase family protein [Lachnospiraceae bacterium]
MQLFKSNLRKVLGSVFGMLFFFVCLFLLNTPEEFTFLPVMMRFADRTMYVLVGCVVILYAFLKEKPFRDGLFLSSFVFCAYVMVTTIANHGQTLTVFNNYLVRSVGTVMLFSLFMDVDPKRSGWTAYALYMLLILLNHATAIGYQKIPWGEPTWIAHQPNVPWTILCGNINLTVIYVMITFALGWFVSERFCKWVHLLNFAMLGFSVYIAVLTECYTGMIVFVLLAVLCLIALLAQKSRIFAWIPRLLNEYVFGVLNAVGAVVCFMISVGKISSVAGLDAQMHGRTPVWSLAIEKFLEKPLFGNGLQVPISESINYSHVHSLFLEMPYLAGIAGALIFFGLSLVMILTIRKAERGSFRYGLSFLFSLFFTAGIVEFYPVQGMFTLFAVLYYGARTAMISKESS